MLRLLSEKTTAHLLLFIYHFLAYIPIEMYISKVLNLSRLTFINHYSRSKSTQVSRQNNTGPQAIEHAELQTSKSLIVIESLKPNPGRPATVNFQTVQCSHCRWRSYLFVDILSSAIILCFHS